VRREKPEYDFTRHRPTIGNTFLPWPERTGAGREFNRGLMRDENSGFFYSYGPEWHHNIVGDSNDGFLENCYYRVNSDGMHWDEYVSEPDLLALGCSITAGVGIPYEYTWPNIYRHVTGESVNAVARPGASLRTMVKSALHHIKHYGLPKKIFILIMDAMRYTFLEPASLKHTHYPRTRVLLYDRESEGYSEGGGANAFVYDDGRGLPIVPSAHFLAEENLTALEHLGYVCDIMNIDLRLSFDGREFTAQFQSMGWDVVPRHTPENEFLPQGKDHELFWDYGWDTTPNAAYAAHPGLQAHLELTSSFLGRQLGPDEWKDVTPWARHKFRHDIPHPQKQ